MSRDAFISTCAKPHNVFSIELTAILWNKMSVTTVANPVTSTVLQALTDYDLHHSGDPERPKTPESPNTRSGVAGQTENPDDWDTEHRRVPPYRPIDPNLRGPERPGGTNPIETTFISTMFLGVRLVGVSCYEFMICGMTNISST